MPDSHALALLTESRDLVAALSLAALWVAESIAPLFAGRDRRGSHLLANLGLAGVDALVATAFATLLLLVRGWAQTRHLGLLDALAVPGWLHWVLAITLFDCWQYWLHRLMHRVPVLWRVHSVHHTDAELDVTTGVRFHPAETAAGFAARLVVVPLLGMTLPELLAWEALALPVVLFHHANVRLPETFDRRLRWLVVTPRMHVLHHSRWQPETDSNYSALLSVWDRLFGTYRALPHPETIALGLDGWREHEWRTLAGMLTAPFRRSPSGARPVARHGSPDATAGTARPGS